jgi:molybdate transport system substrate-binding protein
MMFSLRACILILAVGCCGTATAAEVKAFVANAFKPAMEVLAPEFEQAAGHKLRITYGTAGALRDRLAQGEPADLLLLPRAFFDPLKGEQKIVPGSEAQVAQSLMSLVVRAGAPKPEIGAAETLKKALLDARGIAYADPAHGGLIGIHAAWVIDKLGLTQQLKAKTRLTTGDQLRDLVAHGEVDLGFVLPIIVLGDARLQLTGSLPMELQDVGAFQYLAGVTTAAREPAAAAELVRFLGSPAALPVIRAKGMQPG